MRRTTSAPWWCNDPGLIGRDVKVPVLLSDDADQYLKGRQTSVEKYPGQGAMTAAAEGEGFKLTTDAATLPSPGDIIRMNGGAFRILSVGDGGGLLAEQLTAPKTLDPAASGAWDILRFTVPEANRRVGDKEAVWLEQLKDQGLAENNIAWRFFTSGDSREPELAGIRGALMGSILTLLVTLILCLPIGVAAAIYLEEFAPKNHLTADHRGQHQQSRRGALDRLRPSRPCDVPQFLRPAALGAARSAAWCWRFSCCPPSSSRPAPP